MDFPKKGYYCLLKKDWQNVVLFATNWTKIIPGPTKVREPLWIFLKGKRNKKSHSPKSVKK